VTGARALAAVALVGALAAGAPPARADGAAVLELTLERCPQIDEVRLRELFVIELGTVRPSGARDVDVRLVCDGARVAVELRDRALGRAWRADVDLAATPEETRLRLLVLAVTEQWSLERPAVAAPPPRAAPADVAVVAAAPGPPRPPAWRLAARAVARRAGAPGLWLGGAGVGVERALGRHLGLALDLAAEEGEAAASVARVGVREVVASVGLRATASAGRWSFAAGPGVAVGLASLTATPTAADARAGTLDAAWAGPALDGRARLALGRSAAVVVDVGGGYTTRRVTGLLDGQTPLFELRGPWLALGLGAGVSF
jgi:hypothetical protein